MINCVLWVLIVVSQLGTVQYKKTLTILEFFNIQCILKAINQYAFRFI